MVAYIFYQPNSPEERDIRRFTEELSRLKVDTELVEFDGREGIRLRELYDVLSHPAVVLARRDGSIVEKWPHQLPLVTEISYLVHSR